MTFARAILGGLFVALIVAIAGVVLRYFGVSPVAIVIATIAIIAVATVVLLPHVVRK